MKQRTPRNRPARRPAPVMTVSPRGPRGGWLTPAALVIAMAVVVARMLMAEALRAPHAVLPGSAEVPYGPGPASGVMLDLLAGLCPVLVLLRRALDPTFALRLAWSPLVFVALALWAVASTAWADDRFAAAVSGLHLLSAAGVAWAVVQCVTGWREVRLVAGLAAGLLVVLAAHGVWFDRVERPLLVEQWQKDSAKLLATQNIQPGTFAAKQFENRVTRGELMGLSTSANTYAALLVTLGCVALGLTLDAIARRRWVAGLLLLAALAAAGYVLPKADSRTAYATAAVGATLVLFFTITDLPLKRWPTLPYVLGAIVVLGGVAFVVGYGVSRGALPQESLTFRWRYWVGAWRLWESHRLLGVGYENFGPAYLGVRLPDATEEVKDPHNLFARFLAELGAIGLALAVAWVARLWWELSRPTAPAAPALPATDAEPAAAAEPVTASSLLWPLALAAGVGVVLNALASVEAGINADYTTWELFRRAAYLAIVVAFAATAWLTLRRAADGTYSTAADVGPCRGGLVGTIVAVGMFLVHNLVDFSLFEPGPMFLTALLVGTALGARAVGQPVPTTSAPRKQRPVRVALSLTAAAWLLSAVLVAIPTVSAEADAREADDALRQNRPVPAAVGYESAYRTGIRNADYAARAARAWAAAGDGAKARVMASAAVAAEPRNPGHRLARAALVLSPRTPEDRTPTQRADDEKAALDDLAEAVRLDPNELETRLTYARELERQGKSAEAIEQYRIAVEANDRLPSQEPDRLDEKTAAALRAKVAGATTRPAK